jgi:methenyltetrahydrofolate cyclohydrolase
MTAVKEQTVAGYLEALASTRAVPGGGSAAALAAAMGAALLSMVAKLSARKAKTPEDRTALEELVPSLEAFWARFADMSQEDIEAYQQVVEARKAGAPAAEVERAYQHAAEVPLRVAEAVDECLELATRVSARAWEMTSSDLAVGSELLETAMGGALGNVAVNLPELHGDTARRIEERYLRLRARR